MNNSHNKPVNIVIDAMSPSKSLVNLALTTRDFAAQNPEVNLALVGDQEEIKAALNDNISSNLSIIASDYVVQIDDSPDIVAHRSDSSMAKALLELINGNSNVLISNGSVKHLAASCLYNLPKTNNLFKPGLCLIEKTLNHHLVLIDYFINKTLSSREMFQFATIGQLLSTCLFNLEKSTVGLLNNGTEETKGLEAINECAALAKQSHLFSQFCGFVEANNQSANRPDVLVSDGYSNDLAFASKISALKAIKKQIKLLLSHPQLANENAALAKKLMPSLIYDVCATALVIGVNQPCFSISDNDSVANYKFALEQASAIVKSDFYQKLDGTIAQTNDFLKGANQT